MPGKRKRGRPKTRWKDACQRYLKTTGLRAGEETDRAMKMKKNTLPLFDLNSNKTLNISLNTLCSDSRHVITFSEM